MLKAPFLLRNRKKHSNSNCSLCIAVKRFSLQEHPADLCNLPAHRKIATTATVTVYVTGVFPHEQNPAPFHKKIQHQITGSSIPEFRSPTGCNHSFSWWCDDARAQANQRQGHYMKLLNLARRLFFFFFLSGGVVNSAIPNMNIWLRQKNNNFNNLYLYICKTSWKDLKSMNIQKPILNYFLQPSMKTRKDHTHLCFCMVAYFILKCWAHLYLHVYVCT